MSLDEYFFGNWLSFAWKIESYVTLCFMRFLSLAISGTEIFHKAVCHMLRYDGIINNHFNENLLENLPVKEC